MDTNPLAVFWSPAPTFDLVGGCGPHLGLTVFHQVLEGGDQVCLGDLRPDSFLELQEGKEGQSEKAWQVLWTNETKIKVKGRRTRGKTTILRVTAKF